MKKKQLETLFYSTAGVVAVFVIIVAVNLIGSRAKTRIDMTAEKAYTLSDGTRAILKKLDTPITIRFYYTHRENAMPVMLKNYAQQVEDLLDEYRQTAKGKIEVEKYDPQPDSDAEDSANLDGVEGQMLPTGEKVYLGISISMLNEKSVLPFLTPDRERLLEYDISRAISRVMDSDKPVIGVMTPLQIFGQPPMMRQFGQQPKEPWVLISELKRDFTVKQLMMTTDKIDDDIKVLIVIHPKEIGDPAQYAIDQFLMRGGKLIAFLDPNCYFDDQKQNPMMGGGGPSGSSLDKLLKAWGVEFDSAKVVADMNLASKTRSPDGQVMDAYAVLSLTPASMNKDDVVTGQIDSLLVPFAGVFKGKPVDGLKQEVLLKTSKDSGLVDGFLASLPGDAISKEFKSADLEQALAIRLTGKFKTAFPDGKPKSGEKTDDKEKKQDTGPHLKETQKDTAVILVGDADLLNDTVSVQVQNFFGQRIVIPQNGNLSFAQSAVEQMGGDSNLITVRSRATLNRPFILVKEMEAKAQAAFRDQIKQMEQSLQETQQKLNELQRSKSKDQRMIMSPEQQKELENFKKKEAETNKKLKELRKNLSREVKSLEARLKWQNILAMPGVVTISGIVLAVFKRKRTAAK